MGVCHYIFSLLNCHFQFLISSSTARFLHCELLDWLTGVLITDQVNDQLVGFTVKQDIFFSHFFMLGTADETVLVTDVYLLCGYWVDFAPFIPVRRKPHSAAVISWKTWKFPMSFQKMRNWSVLGNECTSGGRKCLNLSVGFFGWN